MDPAVVEGRLKHLFALRHAHPADQQTTAITGKHGLRGVELKPGVQFVQFAVSESASSVIKLARHPYCRVGVQVALFLTGNPLRTAD